MHVDDQGQALRFYTEVLGFAKKADVSQGAFRWLTVTSPEDRPAGALVRPPAFDQIGAGEGSLQSPPYSRSSSTSPSTTTVREVGTSPIVADGTHQLSFQRGDWGVTTKAA